MYEVHVCSFIYIFIIAVENIQGKHEISQGEGEVVNLVTG